MKQLCDELKYDGGKTVYNTPVQTGALDVRSQILPVVEVAISN